MFRSTISCGWFSAGLLVCVAASALHAQDTLVGRHSMRPGNNVPVLMAAAPQKITMPVPAPRVSAPAPAPRVSAPAQRPAAPAPAPRPSTPATRPSPPAAQAPRQAAPGSPRASAPKTASPPAPKTSRPSAPKTAGPPAPKTARPAGPSTTRPTTPNTTRATRSKPSTEGTKQVQTKSGGQVASGARGHSTYRAPDNKTTAQIHNGRLAEVHQGNTLIQRPAGASRTVIAQRPGNKVVVVRGGGGGYVQRPIVVGGRNFVQRTYYVNRVAYVAAYRPFLYRGVTLAFYAPVHYYPLGLYGWAGDPWGSIDYPWGWGDQPWFGYFGAYFRPWRVYARPSLWLTDFLIGSTLQAAFQAREEWRTVEPAGDDGPVQATAPMSDEVKEMIEAEVRRQLVESQAEAQAEAVGSQVPHESMPPSFTERGPHLFVAGDSLEVENTATGDTCVIGAGDAIRMNGGLPRSGSDIRVQVLASKGSNCPVNSTVSVPLAELVEMHNNMRENIDRGLAALRDGQGTNNLPSLPAGAAGEPTLTTFAASMQPDPDVAQVLLEEASQADQIERAVMADYRTAPDMEPVPGGAAIPPVPSVDNREAGLLASIQTGQTERQVVEILGPPRSTSFLGGLKKLYDYRSGKITFSDGAVSEVDVSAAGALAQRPQASPGRVSVVPSAAPAPSLTPPARTGRPRIAIGLTEGQVVAILGEPRRVSFLGGLKKMYEYADRKIIFTDGSVSEVQ